MQGRIVLVSNDSDFFEFILSKIVLRKNDVVDFLNFTDIPERMNLITPSVLIIDSENSEQQSLALLSIADNAVKLVFAYNNDEKFKVEVYQKGAYAFITPMTSKEELQAILVSALGFSSLLDKNIKYRKMLVEKDMIKSNNEVLLDYNLVLEQELEKVKSENSTCVLVAISPDEKTKFLIQPNQIETIILNNIRKNDLLMSYAVNKYFLLLYDIDVEGARKIWTKICRQLPEKIYAGFTKTLSKNRQQLVNEALNKLHEAINYDKVYSNMVSNNVNSSKMNFKMFRQQLNKKIEKIVIPTFYHIKQKYEEKLFGISIEQEIGEGYSCLWLKGRSFSALFKITSPGFTVVNVDITYISSPNNIDAKRISLSPDEFEAGLLEDLLEQFILEFKKEVNNGT